MSLFGDLRFMLLPHRHTMRFLALIWALILSDGPPSMAQQADHQEWIANISANPAVCHRSVATRVQFSELARNYLIWRGKCVAVDGYWQSHRLFVSKAAARSSGRQGHSEEVGLYGQDVLLRRAPRKATPFTAVGVVGDCEGLLDLQVLVLGYCHYHSRGPYLALAQMIRR